MQKVKNPLETQFTRDFGLEYPIASFGHCRDVIIEVTNAGGFGVYGVAGTIPSGSVTSSLSRPLGFVGSVGSMKTTRLRVRSAGHPCA